MLTPAEAAPVSWILWQLDGLRQQPRAQQHRGGGPAGVLQAAALKGVSADVQILQCLKNARVLGDNGALQLHASSVRSHRKRTDGVLKCARPMRMKIEAIEMRADTSCE